MDEIIGLFLFLIFKSVLKAISICERFSSEQHLRQLHCIGSRRSQKRYEHVDKAIFAESQTNDAGHDCQTRSGKAMTRFLDNLDKLAETSKEIEMNSPECDLKGHGPCGGPICQRGMSLNHRCDAHVRLQSYWTERNPGKKLIDWLDGLRNAERDEVLRKASPRGKYWQEVSVGSAEE